MKTATHARRTNRACSYCHKLTMVREFGQVWNGSSKQTSYGRIYDRKQRWICAPCEIAEERRESESRIKQIERTIEELNEDARLGALEADHALVLVSRLQAQIEDERQAQAARERGI